METIKKYSKMMIDEILGADKYMSMAWKLKDTNEEMADTFIQMAKEELHHKDMLDKSLKTYIEDCEDEKLEDSMEIVYDFIAEINADMEAPILAKMKSF